LVSYYVSDPSQLFCNTAFSDKYSNRFKKPEGEESNSLLRKKLNRSETMQSS